LLAAWGFFGQDAKGRRLEKDMATQSSMAPEDMAEHKRTYARFVRGVAVVAAHALVILAILAWVFSAQMG
jgi:hypothetical protein